MTPRHVPVLIVGAGFAGLTAAALLAWRGVPSLLVERRASVSRQPTRAHGLNMRSMEQLRVIPGLEADLCRVSRAAPYDSTICIAESVAGPIIRTLTTPGDAECAALSPATLCSTGQDRVEPVLLDHARALGADIRFSMELAGFVEEAEGVRAVLRDGTSGRETHCTADYLIAADGADSRIRKALGVPMQGRGPFSHVISILFRTNLRPALPTQGFLLCYLRNEAFTGAFVTTDDPDIGHINVEYDPERESPADYDETRCVAIVRRALGAPHLDVGLLDVSPWKMSSTLAARMAQGRVFLAGDAAHIMPPVGGLAGQAGIQEAADLAWKLAMVIHGHAGRGLLDTYDAERRPVAQTAAARLIANYIERVRPDRTDLPGVAPELDNLSVAVGYRYRSEAIASDADDDLSPVEDLRRPTGRPGSRLAHVPLQRGGHRLSSLDLVGRDLTLLAAPGDAGWTAAARTLRRRLGSPLQAYEIGSDLIDCDDAFLGRTGLERGGALLVRPDGFIAWRARTAVADPPTALRSAVDRALCRKADEAQPDA